MRAALRSSGAKLRLPLRVLLTLTVFILSASELNQISWCSIPLVSRDYEFTLR